MLHRPDGVTNIRALETTLPSQQIVRHGRKVIQGHHLPSNGAK